MPRPTPFSVADPRWKPEDPQPPVPAQRQTLSQLRHNLEVFADDYEGLTRSAEDVTRLEALRHRDVVQRDVFVGSTRKLFLATVGLTQLRTYCLGTYLADISGDTVTRLAADLVRRCGLTYDDAMALELDAVVARLTESGDTLVAAGGADPPREEVLKVLRQQLGRAAVSGKQTVTWAELDDWIRPYRPTCATSA